MGVTLRTCVQGFLQRWITENFDPVSFLRWRRLETYFENTNPLGILQVFLSDTAHFDSFCKSKWKTAISTQLLNILLKKYKLFAFNPYQIPLTIPRHLTQPVTGKIACHPESSHTSNGQHSSNSCTTPRPNQPQLLQCEGESEYIKVWTL